MLKQTMSRRMSELNFVDLNAQIRDGLKGTKLGFYLIGTLQINDEYKQTTVWLRGGRSWFGCR